MLIKRDFRVLGQLVDGAGVQGVFSSIPFLAGKDAERRRKTVLINMRLRGWCHWGDFFSFF